MADKKSERRERMFYEQKNGYDIMPESERGVMRDYCAGYSEFLDAARTEREATSRIVMLAEKKGFVPLTSDLKLKAGSKVYKTNRGKAVMLAVIGKEPIENGANIVASHVDVPRLDLKQLPLYEDSELAYFKTHYYGGIKKYQWLTIPLELHGVVALKGGAVVDVCIGKSKDDPAFVITDLLPHLAADQTKKPLGEAIPGESLNLIIGSEPDAEEGKDRVKLQILTLLNERYGITEEDFLSAELSAVPALPTRDIGLDRSMIGGYGHDDRVCSYAAVMAMLDAKRQSRTAVCVLADKEEIGSEGVTGMQSGAFEGFMEALCRSQDADLRTCFENSLCISSDVCNGFDPNFPEVSEKRNNAKLNYGIALVKYTGSRGKGGANDANAETVARLRQILDEAGVVMQMAELGKVDQGGGGTVAAYMARRNIETIDAGVPVLSMHAPYELVSKLDAYMTYKAMKAVYEEKV